MSTLKFEDKNQMIELSEKMRKKIIHDLNIHGGHLGSNLAIIDLTISLLKKFDYQKSHYLFDTGYQAYTFKTLTDRSDFFEHLDDKKYSIFQEVNEGDPYSGGHTSISAGWAAGYNKIRDDKTVIEIIGDGSLATSIGLGGMLNFANSNKKGLFILNDNKQGIGINQFNYLNWKNIAEGMNYDFYEVEDGHDFDQLQEAWNFYDKSNKNVFVKVNTIKAKGAEIKNPEQALHYVSHDNGQIDNVNDYAFKVVKDEILKKAANDKNVVVVYAGMNYVFGLSEFKKQYPDQFIDAGIAEEIAAAMAAALSNSGKEVYLIVSSSFIQRIYDQVIHDIIRNNLKINIIITGSEITEIGDSHHGIYDLNMFNSFRNVEIFEPTTTGQIKTILNSKHEQNIVVTRLFEKIKIDHEDTDIEKWKFVIKDNNKNLIVTHGNSIWELKNYLLEQNIKADLIDARKLSESKKEVLESYLKDYENIIVYERVFWKNNLFSTITNILDMNKLNIKSISIKNSVIGRGSNQELLKNNNVDFETIKKILK